MEQLEQLRYQIFNVTMKNHREYTSFDAIANDKSRTSFDRKFFKQRAAEAFASYNTTFNVIIDAGLRDDYLDYYNLNRLGA